MFANLFTWPRDLICSQGVQKYFLILEFPKSTQLLTKKVISFVTLEFPFLTLKIDA